MKTDYLVIGSGIAGLSFAIKAAGTVPQKSVLIICKSVPKETNTRYAQGGIAVALDKNKDTEQHIRDTLAAGGSLCDKDVVEFVIREGPARLKELEDWGVNFDKTPDNSYSRAREGGHSSSRILHKGDFTGLEIEKKLLTHARKMSNIRVMEHTFALDLIISPKDNKRCEGAFVLSKTGEIVKVLSKITVLATGGIGQIFEHTTNSKIATGDGIAMAYRAGAKIKNMAFIQFHPTALFEEGKSSDFLISEAVRGLGAVLKTAAGVPFMEHYDLQKELATRDIVSRAIRSEMLKQNKPFVFLDCRHISKKDFIKHFPVISTKCVNLGIDPSQKMIPVTPSAHYCCGGISTDCFGRTSISNLYACGECACTGLHGANRLASNSLLEALVFSHRCYVHSSNRINGLTYGENVRDSTLSYLIQLNKAPTKELINQLKSILTKNISITTSNTKIDRALYQVCDLRKRVNGTDTHNTNTENAELKNMFDVAWLVLNDCKAQVKNAGTFYNQDLEAIGIGFTSNITPEN